MIIWQQVGTPTTTTATAGAEGRGGGEAHGQHRRVSKLDPAGFEALDGLAAAEKVPSFALSLLKRISLRPEMLTETRS